MAKSIGVLGLVAVLSCMSPVSWSETFEFDFDAFTAGIQNSKTVAPNELFPVHVTVTGASNLLGVSTDVLFDPAILQLTDIRENPGDLNFDSGVAGAELNDVIRFFVNNVRVNNPDWVLTLEDPEADEQFFDSNGNRSGVLLDLDGDNMLSGAELNRVISEFVDDVVDRTGASQRVIYWTDQIFGRAQFDFNESVEIYDPPALSNTGGAHPGEILDLTSVLLARPEVVQQGTRPGFGYDGDARIMTLYFRALQAGEVTLQFRDPVFIDESFQDLTDIRTTAGANTATVTVQ